MRLFVRWGNERAGTWKGRLNIYELFGKAGDGEGGIDEVVFGEEKIERIFEEEEVENGNLPDLRGRG